MNELRIKIIYPENMPKTWEEVGNNKRAYLFFEAKLNGKLIKSGWTCCTQFACEDIVEELKESHWPANDQFSTPAIDPLYINRYEQGYGQAQKDIIRLRLLDKIKLFLKCH